MNIISSFTSYELNEHNAGIVRSRRHGIDRAVVLFRRLAVLYDVIRTRCLCVFRSTGTCRRPRQRRPLAAVVMRSRCRRLPQRCSVEAGRRRRQCRRPTRRAARGAAGRRGQRRGHASPRHPPSAPPPPHRSNHHRSVETRRWAFTSQLPR